MYVSARVHVCVWFVLRMGGDGLGPLLLSYPQKDGGPLYCEIKVIKVKTALMSQCDATKKQAPLALCL